MKHGSRTNKKIQKVGLYILVLALVLVSIAATSPTNFQQKSVSEIAVSKYQAAQLNQNLNDEEKIKTAIDAYFTTRYEGQKLLEEQDFSPLLEDTALEWVKKEKDKREVELYIAELFDLKYIDYSYALEYDSIEIKKNKATVQLRESHDVVFESAAPEVSKMADLLHTITLTQKNGFWVISKDQYQDETSPAFDHQTKQELIEQVDENYKLNKKQLTLGPKVLYRFAARPLSLVNYSYNRTAAVNYADTYWSSYNTAWYATYPGNDCTNYISQSIYAGQGKTPPNTSGMAVEPRNINTDWYYVWNNSGSVPWVQVGGQFTFITGNTNKIGPYGASTTSFCNTNVGDVVQLYSSANGWFHEGIITLIVNPCGGLQFYYVNSHTTNRYHYALANWAVYTMRFIKVNGWRGN